MNKFFLLLVCTISLQHISCAQKSGKDTVIILKETKVKTDSLLTAGAWRTKEYFPLLINKSVAVVGNHTSLVRKTHLVDTLLASGIKVMKVFAPEHGFRGTADAGEKIENLRDKKTGLPVISLYGTHNKPTPANLKGIEMVVFDIQDVGARFYTYISTLHYVMEACAENKIPLIVLDRPNPNGFYVDGPILEKKYSSFVGMHPVPIVHGMTIGEYAMMINGERWLRDSVQCDLRVVRVDNYSHEDFYRLSVNPSPNLSDMASVYLYPSLCLFEGTIVSVGRGTDMPFRIFGFPDCKIGTYTFTPKSVKGAGSPPYEGKLCKGFDVSGFGESYIKSSRRIYLFWLKGMYESAPDKTKFFTDYFNPLAGNETLMKQITDGMSEDDIHKSWQDGLRKYKLMRKKYLLYKDFE